MDIYSTTALNRVVPNLIRPQTGLLSAFFGSIETSDTEDIKFDVENKKRRLAPFVSPLREGRIVEDLGYVTNSFKPAYIKDKRVFDPNKALKRKAGETIGGNMAPANREQANLTVAMADQVDMLMRRKEVMAAEVLRTGKCTISGDGYPSVEVDFGRRANNTKTLLTTDRWGETGVSPIEDIEEWGLEVLQYGGGIVEDVIMDTSAWKLFRADTKVEKLLDTRPLSAAEAGVRYVQFAALGLKYKGSVDGYRFWVYSDWYIDDNGAEQPILPEYTVIMASADLDGVQHHGAIRDTDAGLQPLEMFSKSWTVPDPSCRFLLMQSAPLIVPYRPNASMGITVR